MAQIPFGDPVPEHSPFAISVSFPKWTDNISYEKGEMRAIRAMKSGYPRFFISLVIQKLASQIQAEIAGKDESILLLPTRQSSERCKEFVQKQALKLQVDANDKARLAEYLVAPLDACIDVSNDLVESNLSLPVTLYVVIVHKDLFSIAKQYWQHTGDGISSRQADYCNRILEFNAHETAHSSSPAPKNQLSKCLNSANQYSPKEIKTPPYYRKPNSKLYLNKSEETSTIHSGTSRVHPDSSYKTPEDESTRFIEERFGRNLNSNMAKHSKLILRKRIAGLLIESEYECEQYSSSSLNFIDRGISSLSESDVFLTSTGMGAIFHTHRIVLENFSDRKSVCFGFVYTDTLKILEKFGPGVLFFGNGEGSDYDQLEEFLVSEPNSIAALFTEFPSNPLLKSPDLARLRRLSDKFNFVLVVDDSIGNFVNLDTLPIADVVVSSLSKLFSGDSNVMGGSIILNPKGKHHQTLKTSFLNNLEDILWWEDAIFLERNSRNFVERNKNINSNAEMVFSLLSSSKHVEKLFYPKVTCNDFYEAVKRKSPDSGYGGLLSVVFKSEELAKKFYDSLQCSKGPSLGTNFTLASPYTILAHFNELDWASSYGVSPYLIRISVGLEDRDSLYAMFSDALESLDS